jgi:hypothetical protein
MTEAEAEVVDEDEEEVEAEAEDEGTLSDEEMEKVGDDPGADGCHNCGDVSEAEMMVAKDLNFAYAWKSGNKFARICPECGARTFTAGSYWESEEADPTKVAWVIEKGDTKDDARPRFYCPYDEEVVDEEPCGERFLGAPHNADAVGPEECPHCGRELQWEDEAEDGDTQ